MYAQSLVYKAGSLNNYLHYLPSHEYPLCLMSGNNQKYLILNVSCLQPKMHMIVRLYGLRKTILNFEYQVFMCDCVFVDGCLSQS